MSRPTQIKLTDKAREALLYAELIAWAQKHEFVEADDVRYALSLQEGTVAKKVLRKLQEIDLKDLHLDFDIDLDLRRDAALQFAKIPLSDEMMKILETAALEASEFGYSEEINTGHLLLCILYSQKDFLNKLQDLKTDLVEYRLKLFSITADEKLVDKEIQSGHTTLSRFKRQVMSWLREGNLTEELLETHDIDLTVYSQSTITSKLLEFFNEEDNKEIPEKVPPLGNGIREKARRDLEVCDSYVSAKNLPNPEPDLIGMYIINSQDYILFYPDGFVYSGVKDPFLFKYSDMEAIERNIHDEEKILGKVEASIVITGSGEQEIEVEISACTNDIPDIYAIDEFLECAIAPQPISEIDTDWEYIRFLKRQNTNLDLYYKLAYRTEELFYLRLWDREPTTEDTALFRLLAILATAPMHSILTF